MAILRSMGVKVAAVLSRGNAQYFGGEYVLSFVGLVSYPERTELRWYMKEMKFPANEIRIDRIFNKISNHFAKTAHDVQLQHYMVIPNRLLFCDSINEKQKE